MKDDAPTTTEITEYNDGARVFRLNKSYRNQGIFLLIFFVLVGIGFAYGMWIDAPPKNKFLLISFITLVWSFMTGISLRMLLGYKYESLTIQNGAVIQQGVIFRKEIDLSSVKQAHWNLVQGGGITLKSLTDKISIYLEYFEREERLWLIHYFQSSLSESVQQNWELFCHKLAIPLRDYKPEKFQPPGADEVLLTRKRWDCYFIPFVVFCAVLGIIATWKFQLSRLLIAPILPTILWLSLRYATPKRGVVCQRISADKEFVKLWKFIAWWSFICLIIFAILKLLNPPGIFGEFPGFTVMILWMLVAYWRIFQSDRYQHKHDLENAKQAVQQWKDGPESVQNSGT